MMQSEIHRKISSNSEDNLTSYFCSAFRYFANNEVLIEFLREASKINGQKLILSEIKNIQVYFWPKFNFPETRNRESDVILIFEEDGGRIVAMVIEAKYNSGLSNMPDEINEDRKKYNKNTITLGHQLSDEYCGIMCGQWLSDGLEGQLIQADWKLLVYITSNYEFPLDDIDQAIINIKRRKCKNTKHYCSSSVFEIYWLSWRTLYALLKQYKENHSQRYLSSEENYFFDLFEILDLRDLKEFKIFEALAPVADYEGYFLADCWGNYAAIPEYASFLKI